MRTRTMIIYSRMMRKDRNVFSNKLKKTSRNKRITKKDKTARSIKRRTTMIRARVTIINRVEKTTKG